MLTFVGLLYQQRRPSWSLLCWQNIPSAAGAFYFDDIWHGASTPCLGFFFSKQLSGTNYKEKMAARPSDWLSRVLLFLTNAPLSIKYHLKEVFHVFYQANLLCQATFWLVFIRPPQPRHQFRGNLTGSMYYHPLLLFIIMVPICLPIGLR